MHCSRLGALIDEAPQLPGGEPDDVTGLLGSLRLPAAQRDEEREQ
jgi:hypothetical protein